MRRRTGAGGARALVTSLVLLLGLVSLHATAKPVPEINSAIIMTSMSDWGPTSDRCTAMVDRAAQIRQTRLMFVPTLYFVDSTGASHDTGQSRVSHWCYTRDAGGWCPPATPDQTAAFRAGMTKCFKHAVARGMNLAVAPHVDDGTGSGLWRNGLVFDPAARYGALSYAEFMLYPLADALNAAMGPTTRVWLANEGEMGATLVYYPASHAALLAEVKARVAAGKPPGTAARVATGVLTNADKLCQCIRQEGGSGPNGSPPPSYSAQFRAAWPRVAASFDTAAIRALFEAADFIGFSNYPTLPRPAVQPADLEAGTATFAAELAVFGIDLRALIARRGTALFFSEVGVGGGADAWGGNPTSDPAAAAAAPFYGVTSAYRPDADPWHRDGGGGGSMGSFLRSFYVALSQYAAARGACPGCKFPGVDGVFLWNCGSWDVEGVHPSSWAGDDPGLAPSRVGGGQPYSYRDAGVVGLIANHNTAAAGAPGGGFGRLAPGADGGGGGEGRAAAGAAPAHPGPAPQDVTSRAAVMAESARLAAAMMAAVAEEEEEEEKGNSVEEGEGEARPGLARAGTAAVRAALPSSASSSSSPAIPAPHDLAVGATDGAFSSFAELQETLLAAVDRLGLPGGGSGQA